MKDKNSARKILLALDGKVNINQEALKEVLDKYTQLNFDLKRNSYEEKRGKDWYIITEIEKIKRIDKDSLNRLEKEWLVKIEVEEDGTLKIKDNLKDKTFKEVLKEREIEAEEKERKRKEAFLNPDYPQLTEEEQKIRDKEIIEMYFGGDAAAWAEVKATF